MSGVDWGTILHPQRCQTWAKTLPYCLSSHTSDLIGSWCVWWSGQGGRELLVGGRTVFCPWWLPYSLPSRGPDFLLFLDIISSRRDLRTSYSSQSVAPLCTILFSEDWSFVRLRVILLCLPGIFSFSAEGSTTHRLPFVLELPADCT